MEKLNLAKFDGSKLESIEKVWGGQSGSCNHWTSHRIYTGDDCTVDQYCWICDDTVAQR